MVLFTTSDYNRGYYNYFANVRFDVRTKEHIEFHWDTSSFNQSIYDHFPDPTLSYTDNRGSDLLNMLEGYLNIDTRANRCGSFVYVMVGRYPDDADVSQLIRRFREQNIFVYFIAKATPSAGSSAKPFYDLATAVNGFSMFADGTDYGLIGWNGMVGINPPYQFVSKNYVVSGSGRLEMSIQTPNPNHTKERIFVFITL